jgi:hypothetical protein
MQILVSLSSDTSLSKATQIANAICLFENVLNAEPCVLKVRAIPDAADLPIACANGNHYTNDGRGRELIIVQIAENR